jgi:hypothetical protein
MFTLDDLWTEFSDAALKGADPELLKAVQFGFVNGVLAALHEVKSARNERTRMAFVQLISGQAEAWARAKVAEERTAAAAIDRADERCEEDQ